MNPQTITDLPHGLLKELERLQELRAAAEFVHASLTSGNIKALVESGYTMERIDAIQKLDVSGGLTFCTTVIRRLEKDIELIEKLLSEDSGS